MHLNQDESKVSAEGMSSAEESKWRYWDTPPELFARPVLTEMVELRVPEAPESETT